MLENKVGDSRKVKIERMTPARESPSGFGLLGDVLWFPR